MYTDDIRKAIREQKDRHRTIKHTFVAGEDIVAQSAVYLDAAGTIRKFDSTNLLLNRKCLGVTTGPAYEGKNVCVVLFGEVKIQPATLILGAQYFAVEDGALDISFPIPGLIAKVGTALSECILFVDVDHEEPQGIAFNIYVQDYTVTGAFDGINVDFQTTASFTPGTLGLYLNGVRLYLDDDYVITGPDTFQLTFIPNVAGKILAEYIPI